MILLVVAALALLGGTTWIGLQQPIAPDPERNLHRTVIGIRLCLLTGLTAILAAAAAAALSALTV
jgi:hypothetical protein